MYKFVKVKNLQTNESYERWYLYCDSVECLLEHFEKYIKHEISKGFSDGFNHARTGDHYKTSWASLIDLMSTINNKPFLEQSLTLENEMFESRMKMIQSDGGCLLTDGLTVMPISGFKIIDECDMHKMIWPTYSESDIRVITWPGGIHFYAKIGNMDVVDSESNQKWNSWDEAYEKAKEFLNKINQ